MYARSVHSSVLGDKTAPNDGVHHSSSLDACQGPHLHAGCKVFAVGAAGVQCCRCTTGCSQCRISALVSVVGAALGATIGVAVECEGMSSHSCPAKSATYQVDSRLCSILPSEFANLNRWFLILQCNHVKGCMYVFMHVQGF